MAWLVSTLPATTAAGKVGLSMEPSGAIRVIGAMQPSFSGMSSSISVRNTYSTAARHTDQGALKLFGRWGLEPVKSTAQLRDARSTVTRTAISAPSSISRRKAPSCSRSMTRRTASAALAFTWPI